ncbi:FIG00985363: hypothetical protein [hydrothermal vent metagenome]|uniref:Uncharacterized protein n=1 Tax=hydrothermal vent metagenome TaxID=652676 RepID=A0A3B0TDI2_9ZZZZ
MDQVTNITADGLLSSPLAPEMALTYWQLSETIETAYDLADQTMHGEMDPLFFLTKHKNFIPHEYPCRTRFAGDFRNKRPVLKGSFLSKRNWLPFGSKRIDLSGFWFRPTRIGTWAKTIIDVKEGGAARLGLTTCGGAILLVNAVEAGWMAPYSRNLEHFEEFSIVLKPGRNEIILYFDDLAERDARYFFQLDYLDGPQGKTGFCVAGDIKIAKAIETALTNMHFEKPAYSDGEVALAIADPLPVDAEVQITIEGDFMSEEKTDLTTKLPASSTRLVIGNVEDLPADFRHFAINIAAGGFQATRILGVEICHARRQGEAPALLDQRIVEALAEVARYGEADSVTALARLAIGRKGKKTEKMIGAILGAVEKCYDCADFILLPLIWIRAAYHDDLSPDLVARIDKAIVGYRYWMDEPGNDVQWYFSENHALLFHCAAYLGGNLLPGERFVRSGRLGAEQSLVGANRVRAWLDHFEQWEMAEFNSAPYFPIDLKGLTSLFAFAPDPDIRERARAGIVRLLEIVANSSHHGMLTGAQGRSYEHTLRAGRSLELSAMARMLWGKGNYGRRFHALPQLALCLRDHGLKLPKKLSKQANYRKNKAQQWCFAQGQNRFARLYHYKCANYAIGSAANYRWGEWGYQETAIHLRIGKNPDAQIWINHPGETIVSGFGRPSYWGGSGTLGRVQQYRGLAIIVFDCHKGQPEFSHAYFPEAVFDQTLVNGPHAVARMNKGFAFLGGGKDFDLVSKGPMAASELRQNGRKTSWIVRLGTLKTREPIKRVADKFATLEMVEVGNNVLAIDDPDYGQVLFYPDGRIKAQNRMIDPETWTIAGQISHLDPATG